MGDIDLDRIIADLQERRARLAKLITETVGTPAERQQLRDDVDQLKVQIEAENQHKE